MIDFRWIVFAATIALVCAAPTAGSAASCEELWFERNGIFKQAGFCFKTSRAIRSFGNAGCQYDDEADVPLSARNRALVAEIKREERARGCR